MRTITIVNQSTVVSDDDFAAAAAACQKQLDQHFAPLWGGLTAQLIVAKADPSAPHDVIGEVIYVLDDSDQQDALGYHEIGATNSPVGFVFAKTTIDAGDKWQVTLSHELLEELVDPYIGTCVEVQLPAKFGRVQNAVVAYEVCDPVEEDSYQIDGVPMSNFVTPAWFQSTSTLGVHGPYDYLGKLTAPLTLTPGGYISYSTNLRSWSQLTARFAVKPEKYIRRGRKKR